VQVIQLNELGFFFLFIIFFQPPVSCLHLNEDLFTVCLGYRVKNHKVGVLQSTQERNLFSWSFVRFAISLPALPWLLCLTLTPYRAYFSLLLECCRGNSPQANIDPDGFYKVTCTSQWVKTQ
jgi:hypothetical protein